VLDFATELAPHLYAAIRAERDVEAGKRRWRRRLRELRAAERAAIAREKAVKKPGHLAGAHKI
jgi:hypothetical protein